MDNNPSVMLDENTIDRCNRAVIAYLQKKNSVFTFTTDVSEPVVAVYVDRGEREIAFVAVHFGLFAEDDKYITDTDVISRAQFEQIAVGWLAKHSDFSEMRIRLDVIQLLVIGSSGAVLRHHKSVYGAGE